MRQLALCPLLLLPCCTFDTSGRPGEGVVVDGSQHGDAALIDLQVPGNDAPAVEGGAAEGGAMESGVDAAVYNDGQPGWPHRKRITVSGSMTSQALNDFPLLVRIDNDTELAAGALQDGSDIVFRALNGTQLAHEIEAYDPVSGTLEVWVKVPLLSATSGAELHLLYGNKSPPAPPKPEQVWSNGYLGVWHLTGSTIVDSGSSHHTATVNGGVTVAAGKIASGRQFDTQPASWIDLGDGPLAQSAPFTIEAWFAPSSPQNGWIGLATKGRSTDAEWAGIWLKPDQLLTFGWSWKSPGSGNMDSAGIKPAAGKWHHAAAVFDGTQISLYYNGAIDTNSPKTNAYNLLDGALVLGTDQFDNNPSFDGVIDEVRLSGVARGPGWIGAQYANQADPTAQITVGKQEPNTP